MTEQLPQPTAQPPEAGKRSKPLGTLLEILEILLLAAVFYIGIDAVVARLRVESISMLPTLRADDFILVNKLAYHGGTPQRGDIVVFRAPPDPSQDYVKRVIGLPGDVISVRNGMVYVNNEPLKEPYIAAEPAYTGTWVVPPGELFVLGDNRNQSSDSHSWGFVPMQSLVGRALVVYWPPNQAKLLTDSGIAVAAGP